MFRFGNSLFEPLWNRNHIEYVEITAAETLGVGSRASYYEEAGALRDMVTNHLETMPTDACMFFYECTRCKTILRPKQGDCCVFCSYGSLKCPPIQARRDYPQ